MEELRAEVEAERKKSQEFKTWVGKLDGYIEDLEVDLEDEQRKSQNLATQVGDLDAYIKDLEKDLDHEQKRSKKLAKYVQELEEELEEEQRKRLATHAGHKEAYIMELEKELQEQQRKTQEWAAAHQDLEQVVEEQQRTSHEQDTAAGSRYADFEQELEEERRKCEELEDELESERMRSEELEEELQRKSEELQRDNDKLKEKVSELETQLAQKTEGAYGKNVQELQRDNDKLKEKVSELETQLAQKTEGACASASHANESDDALEEQDPVKQPSGPGACSGLASSADSHGDSHGRIVQPRDMEDCIEEAEKIVRDPDFQKIVRDPDFQEDSKEWVIEDFLATALMFNRSGLDTDPAKQQGTKKQRQSGSKTTRGKDSEELPPVKALADALRQPIKELPGPACDLAFCKALGALGDRKQETVRRLLFEDSPSREQVQKSIVEYVTRGLQTISDADEVTAHGLQSKFSYEEGFTMAFAKLPAFFGGLEEMVGIPDNNVFGGMEKEHCLSKDSKLIFQTGNYGIATTSRVEWLFVNLCQPAPPFGRTDIKDGRDAIDLKEVDAKNSEDEDKYFKSLNQGKWPAEDENKLDSEHFRKYWDQDTRDGILERINSRLDDLKEAPLGNTEFIGARLYTGPMFEKYNSTLRGGALNAEGVDKKVIKRWKDLCYDNRYTTTIHAISSALIKLGKMTKAGPVFRGISKARLPDWFMNPDEFCVAGGVERAFLSATRDRNVAKTYAGTKMPTILEMEMGMVNRGADLGDLSQYPHEQEVCFGPLTALQVKSTSVDGHALVVGIQPCVNLNNPVMEKVISKRKDLIIEMCQHFQDECKVFLTQHMWTHILDGSYFRARKHVEEYMAKRPKGDLSDQEGGHLEQKGDHSEQEGDHSDLLHETAEQISESEAEKIVSVLVQDLSRNFKDLYNFDPSCFTDDRVFRTAFERALELKEDMRLATSTVLAKASMTLQAEQAVSHAKMTRCAGGLLEEDELYDLFLVDLEHDDIKDLLREGKTDDKVAQEMSIEFPKNELSALPLFKGDKAGSMAQKIKEAQKVSEEAGGEDGSDGQVHVDTAAQGDSKVIDAELVAVDTLQGREVVRSASELVSCLRAVKPKSNRSRITLIFRKKEVKVPPEDRLHNLLKGAAQIPTEGGLAAMVGRHLKIHPLAKIDLKGAKLPPTAIQVLACGLEGCSGLKELILSENNVGDVAVADLCGKLCELGPDAELHTLNLDTCELLGASAKDISAVLMKLPNLENVDLSHNNFGDASCALIVRCIRDGKGSGKSFKCIKLRECTGIGGPVETAKIVAQLRLQDRIKFSDWEYSVMKKITWGPDPMKAPVFVHQPGATPSPAIASMGAGIQENVRGDADPVKEEGPQTSGSDKEQHVAR